MVIYLRPVRELVFIEDRGMLVPVDPTVVDPLLDHPLLLGSGETLVPADTGVRDAATSRGEIAFHTSPARSLGGVRTYVHAIANRVASGACASTNASVVFLVKRSQGI